MMFGYKRLTFSKSYEHFHKSSIFRASPPPRYMKPAASIRCYSNEDELKAFFVSYGYSFETNKNFRRIFIETTLENGPQLHCGHIPNDVTERELFETIQQYGKIHELCLMWDASKEKHRGFAFIKFGSEADQRSVMEKMADFEIRPGKQLKFSAYKAKCSLFIANIPKSMAADQLRLVFGKHLTGIINVIIYRPYQHCAGEENRGFCFLEFTTHELAWKAKHLIEKEPRIFFTNSIFVDWADSMDTPTEEIMQNVRILYVRNVHVTEEKLEELFRPFGDIERVKKIKHFAFVHFINRSDALNAMNGLQDMLVCGEKLMISWSYPPLDKKKREEILRMRQQRITREYSIRIRY